MKKYKGPTYLTLFVTNRCQLDCCHCFYSQYINKSVNQLSLSNIKKIATTLDGPLQLLTLTGGEPFLCRDLEKILLAFSKFNQTKKVYLTTNGWQVEDIYKKVKKMSKKVAGSMQLHIQVSLDGLEEVHDQIRGKKGSFKRAIATLNRLKTIADIDISVMTTIHKLNYHNIPALIEYINLLSIKHKHQFLRYDNYHHVYGLDKELYNNFKLRKNGLALKVPELHFINSVLNKSDRDLLQMEKREAFISKRKLRKTFKQNFACMAGFKNATIYEDGKVTFCEPIKPFIDLKDYSYNFNKMWNSLKANDMRKIINKCYCADPCNLLISMNAYSVNKT